MPDCMSASGSYHLEMLRKLGGAVTPEVLLEHVGHAA